MHWYVKTIGFQGAHNWVIVAVATILLYLFVDLLFFPFKSPFKVLQLRTFDFQETDTQSGVSLEEM